MIKELEAHIKQGGTLSTAETYELMHAISSASFTTDEIASFLDTLASKPIEKEALLGFRNALQELSLNIDLSDFDCTDIVGTGGDGKDTFNISTTAAFIIAGAGYKVAKHGNYGVSSTSGSANTLETLGVTFINNESVLQKAVDRAGICFMHAPLFHPAMKIVAPARKQLSKKTVFNILGPLVNPANTGKIVAGVYSPHVGELYDFVLGQAGKTYTVVHALDGYDEISLTEEATITSNGNTRVVSASDFGLQPTLPEELAGGETIEETAKQLFQIIKDEGSQAQTNAAMANAALGISLFNEGMGLDEATDQAKESIKSGKAFIAFKKLVEIMGK